ncbi:MAG TPA: ATP-binding protein [Candidatus Xenobia bacterium]|nr:ATP-binding protein [Candidatus Xenobia bacterium]
MRVEIKSRPWLIAGAAGLALLLLFGLAARVLYDRTEQRVVAKHARDHQLVTQFAAGALVHRAESFQHAAEILAARLEAAPENQWPQRLASASLPARTRVCLLRPDGTLLYPEQAEALASLSLAAAPWRGSAGPVLTNPFSDGASVERQLALLVPLRRQERIRAHLVLTFPLEALLGEPLRFGGGAEQPNLALLDEEGTVLVNTRHPEMLGRRIPAAGHACQPCHSDFALERRMLAGETGAGQLQVAQEPLALVTFAPVEVAGRRWSLSLSQPYSTIVAETHRGFRSIVFLLGFSLLVGLAAVGGFIELRARQRRAEERARMAERQAAMESRLRQSEQLASMGRMASQIAHQINTPLATLGLNVAWLEEEVKRRLGRRDLELEEVSRALAGEIERLQRVVNEYLRFGRLPQAARTRQSLRAAVEGYLAFFEPELRTRGLRLETELDADAEVELDATLFGQAFGNLVRNAIEASAENGTLRVELERHSDHVALHVHNDGPPIPAAHRPRLFEPFFTTKPNGTGLGLAYARRVVEEHGGTIDCTSAPGAGTTFTVRLPRAPARAPGEESKELLLAGAGR